LATYTDSEVVSAAIERWHSRTAEQGPDSASQVRRLEAEISGNETAVQRYYNAFENGRLPEARFATRVDALERLLTELRAKLEEVCDYVKSVEAPSKKAVRDAEEAVRDAMLNGTPGQRKALLKELIVEVRVESRESSQPSGFPLLRFALWKQWWTRLHSIRTPVWRFKPSRSRCDSRGP
jgi:site-specific DNA recombinase